MSANLTSLLNAAAGEIGLPTRVGKFLRALGQSLVSSGVSSPQYLQVKRVGSTQAGVGANTTLALNGIVAQRGITYDTATASAFLTPGKTYRLTAHGCFNNYSPDPTTGGLQIQWVDDNNTVLSTTTGDCPKANHVDPRSTGGQSEEPTTEIVWTCPIGATNKQKTVKVRCTGGTGTADLLSGFYTAVIQEIPG